MKLAPASTVTDLIARGYDAPGDDDEFNQLALELHADQRRSCSVVARLSGASVRSWREIPLVPTRLFSTNVIATFPESEARHVFESSGTTRADRGRHLYRDLSLHRLVSVEAARWALRAADFRVRSLVEPSPNSSLARMISWIAEVHSSASDAAPHFIIGTAFSFVKLMDDHHHEILPPGSLVMQTGGYKGRTREISQSELYEGIAGMYGISTDQIFSEYGMCEITTSFWERPGEPGFMIPPWARIRTLDPESMDDAGEGMIAIYDLANAESSVGIMTADWGRVEGNRLILAGRMQGAPMKGCSLTV